MRASIESGGQPVELGLSSRDQLAGALGGEAFVRDPLERRELLGAQRRAERRHHRVLVPLEHRRRVAQI